MRDGDEMEKNARGKKKGVREEEKTEARKKGQVVEGKQKMEGGEDKTGQPTTFLCLP